ncbi:MAG: hypothetical protein KDB80_04555 [Planctomycetes bacterium]|nr:hypothetical protein [Planctomycetota bacterium]
MITRLAPFVAIAALAAGSPAQSLIVPTSAALADGTSSTAEPLGGSGGRSQCVYPSSQFAGGGSILTITRLRWRADAGQIGTGGNWTTVRVDIGTSANPYNALSSTFASNLGADVITGYMGPVTVLPASGGSPNDVIVDVTLTTPYAYNIASGDLLIDIHTSLYSGDSNGRVLDSVSGGAEGGRVFSTGRSSPTGTVDGDVLVVMVDYTTMGGAAVAPYGTGCGGGGNGSTFYELFDGGNPFDLGGPGTGWTALLSTPSYFALQSSTAIVTPTGPATPFTDDQIQSFLLPWSMPYPGGTTSTIWVSSNGFIALESTSNAGDMESLEDFLSGPPRFAPLWRDFNPGANGAIHAEQDPGDPTKFHVTFVGVPEFPNTGSNTFQTTFEQNGSITVSYGSCSTTNALVGFTNGGDAVDRGGLDISTETVGGWFPGADTDAIELRVQGGATPIAGTTITLEVDQVPFSAFAATILTSFQKQFPGLDLAIIGMPGCELYVGNVLTSIPVTLTGAVTETRTFDVPNSPFWIGNELHMQAAIAGATEVQPLPVAVSNGLSLLIDTF